MCSYLGWCSGSALSWIWRALHLQHTPVTLEWKSLTFSVYYQVQYRGCCCHVCMRVALQGAICENARWTDPCFAATLKAGDEDTREVAEELKQQDRHITAETLEVHTFFTVAARRQRTMQTMTSESHRPWGPCSARWRVWRTPVGLSCTMVRTTLCVTNSSGRTRRLVSTRWKIPQWTMLPLT